MKKFKRVIIQSISLFFLLFIGIVFWLLNLNLTESAVGKRIQIVFSFLSGFKIVLISSIIITIANTKNTKSNLLLLGF